MSSTSSLSRQVTSYSSSDIVQQQITSTGEQINGLSSDLTSISNAIQNLIAELQAMSPPTMPSDTKDDKAMAAYQKALTQYQQQVQNLKSKIDDLNEQSERVAANIQDLQDKVQSLENSDLPAAQRADTESQEQQLKSQRDTYESLGKSIEKSSGSAEADRSSKADVKKTQMRLSTAGQTSSESSQNDSSLQLRVSWRNSSVTVDQSSDLKTLVRAFSVSLASASDGTETTRSSNPAVAMPSTPGSGLPPVGTP